MKRILYITLKRRWFIAIAQGKKTIEHREIKPFWISRIENRSYDEIFFRNGYSKSSPFLKAKYLGYTKKNGRYNLRIGKVLQIQK